MQYRRLGRSGLQVSELSFGSWVTFHTQVDVCLAEKLLAISYEAGINFFDNAEAYAGGQSETIMGRALKKLDFSRDSYCVSSKVFWGGQKPTQRGLSRKHIFDACHAALQRLQVDYLDLYFCHRPDLHVPVEETVRAMSDLVTQGKVLYWGTSEWGAQELTEAYGIARELGAHAPVMEQPQYNLFTREKVDGDYLPLFQKYGLGTTIWSPLASGLLTGKYLNGIPKDSRMSLPGMEWLRGIVLESEEGQVRQKKAKDLVKIATEVGCSLAQLSIAWCLKNPNVNTVILGASREEQLVENLKAQEFVSQLTPDVLNTIETIVGNKPVAPRDFLK